ncbi:Acylpyruvase fahd1, mitochondrial [Saguinus oedipus]|uniref:Oxaloacetate tautomerase FAHD1, mitochondrial n=1 Tax=Saguinus oedipus TaxID=9490 RepID=A0ABQ9V293_SAGOE|nr:Acylpyruvase fahd1, mitochondrial [Saguinus oedipus]
MLSEPVLFLKLSTAYLPENLHILMPIYGHKAHRELELGVVMGKHGLTVPKATAMDYVDGYALCQDVTAWDVQDEGRKKGLPWTLAKSFMASGPVSGFVPKEEISDPHNLRLWLKVNSRQEGETSSMIFPSPTSSAMFLRSRR